MSNPTESTERTSTESRAVRGIELGRVAGIAIRLDYSWIFIFLLVLWSLAAGYFPRVLPGQGPVLYLIAGVAATALFFASILVHELAHAIVAVRHGIRVPSITLFLFGGVSELEQEGSEPGVEAKIAVVGPLTSFALAGIFLLGAGLLAADAPVVNTVLVYLAAINFALGVFNLLPGFPLDGGRLLRAYLWKRRGSVESATRTAANVGKGMAVGVMLLGAAQLFAGALVGGLWLILIGLFLRSMAEAGYQGRIQQSLLEAHTVDSAMVRNPVCVPASATLQELVEDYVLATGHRSFPVTAGPAAESVTGDRHIVGVVSLEDVKGVAPHDRERQSVDEHMRRVEPGLTISADATLADAVSQMNRNALSILLVMQGGELRGLLTMHDTLRRIQLHRELAVPTSGLTQ